MCWLVPRRTPQIWYNKVKGATMFLGGINSSLCLLSLLVLRAIGDGLFAKQKEREILYASFAVGHFSQFIINVPCFLVSKGLVDKKGKRLNSVLKANNMKWQELEWVKPDTTMLFIFVIDGLGFAANAYVMSQ